MFLGGDEDLDPGNSSILNGMPARAVLHQQAAKPLILDQQAFLYSKEADMPLSFYYL
jgi:hypothetical protein